MGWQGGAAVHKALHVSAARTITNVNGWLSLMGAVLVPDYHLISHTALPSNELRRHAGQTT